MSDTTTTTTAAAAAAATNSGGKEFDEDVLEQKLLNLKDTQDGIQQMSAWCLQQRNHHKKIVSSWLKVLKQVRVEHRLTLFYLANDVIQYSKRKHYEFVESWGTTLQKATTMVRDEKVRGKIFRIFKIWEQREIYSEEYLSDLNGLLSMNPVKKTEQQPSSDSDDFQNTALISNVRECVKLGIHTDKTFKRLPRSPNCDIEVIKQNLKDRSHSEDVEKELGEYMTSLETFIKCLKAEIISRKSLLNNIQQAETFYQNQRGEVKVVVNAYKNFGNRIKLVKKKLDEITPNLPSPIPSPDINAPSPEQDDDLDLPDDNYLSTNVFKNPNGYTSYMDGNLPFDINDFKRKSPQHNYDNSPAHPIQVINSRNENKSPYETSEYYKPIEEATYTTQNPPLPVPPVANYVGPDSAGATARYPRSELVDYEHSTSSYDPIRSGYPNDTNYSSNSNYSNMPLMPPPPMPPLLDTPVDDFNSTWNMDMTWTSMNSTVNSTMNASTSSSINQGNFSHPIETPVSPPQFDQEGVNTDLIEYVENENENMISLQDVDHRQLHMSSTGMGLKHPLSKEKSRFGDVDHRNLISLTGSPGDSKNPENWNSNKSKSSNNNTTPSTWVNSEKEYRNSSTPIKKDNGQNRQQNIDKDFRRGALLEIPKGLKPVIPQSSGVISEISLNEAGTQKNSSDLCPESLPPPPIPPSLDPTVFQKFGSFLTPPPNIFSTIPSLNVATNLNASAVEENEKSKESSPSLNFGSKNSNEQFESVDMEVSDDDLEFSKEEVSNANTSNSDAPANIVANSCAPTEVDSPNKGNPLNIPTNQQMIWENTNTPILNPNLFGLAGAGNSGIMTNADISANAWKLPPRMPLIQGTPPTFGGRNPFNSQKNFGPNNTKNSNYRGQSSVTRPQRGGLFFPNRGRGGAMRGGVSTGKRNFRGGGVNPWK